MRLVIYFSFYPSALFLVSSSAWDEGALNIGDPDGPDWRTLILFDGAAAAGERGRGR